VAKVRLDRLLAQEQRLGDLARVIRFAPQLQLALPTGRYGTVTFTIHQGTEAPAIDATAQARFVAGNFVGAGMDGSRYACLVQRWVLEMTVPPYGG
jgi:hypothetical protein